MFMDKYFVLVLSRVTALPFFLLVLFSLASGNNDHGRYRVQSEHNT